MGAVENLVAEGLGVIENVVVGPPGLARVGHLLAVGVGIELVGVGILAGLGSLALLTLPALIVAGLVLAVLYTFWYERERRYDGYNTTVRRPGGPPPPAV